MKIKLPTLKLTQGAKVALALILAVMALLFLACSFVALSFSPANWHVALRVTYTLLSLALIIFVADQYFK
jgi:hypothetical protein